MFNMTSANDSILNPDLIDYWNFEKISFLLKLVTSMPHGDFVLPVMFQATALKEHKHITSRMIAIMSQMVY